MWIKRSTYEKLQDEYDKLQISNLLLGKRLILSERKLKETEVKNGLEIVPELKRQISELKDQNKVMREMLKEEEELKQRDAEEKEYIKRLEKIADNIRKQVDRKGALHGTDI